MVKERRVVPDNVEIKNVLVETARVGLTYNSLKQSLGCELIWNQDGLVGREFINIWELPDLLDKLDVEYFEDLEGQPLRMEGVFSLGSRSDMIRIGQIVKEKWWVKPTEQPQELLDAFNDYLGIRRRNKNED